MPRILRLLLLVAVFATSLAGFRSQASASSVIDPVPAGWPKSLSIPRIHVAAPVESLALNRSADQKAPYRWGDVAWYDRGPRPGDAGRATIYGHLDSTCCPAVFYEIRLLKPGDVVKVAYKGNRSILFRVMWQHTYLNRDVPVNFMFQNVRERGLLLVTCTGIFHYDGTGYDHKLIVYARLILPSGQLG